MSQGQVYTHLLEGLIKMVVVLKFEDNPFRNKKK